MPFHQSWLAYFTFICPTFLPEKKSLISNNLFWLEISICVQFIFPLKKIGFVFSYSFPTLFCSLSDVIADRLMPICHSSTLFIFSENILCLLFWVLQPEKNQIQIRNNNITTYQWQISMTSQGSITYVYSYVL